MYVESGLGGYRTRRGMGAAENPDTNVYFADGTVVPEDYNTTYGAVSGGTYPPSPFKTSFCITPTFPWFFGTTVAGAPGVCSSTVTIPSPWNEILTFAVPAAILFAVFRRGR